MILFGLELGIGLAAAWIVVLLVVVVFTQLLCGIAALVERVSK